MIDPKQQAMIDAQTWVPVAFFSWIEDRSSGISVYDPLTNTSRAELKRELHQLWVSALGQTEWRKIETRNLNEMAKAYAECNAFNERPEHADDREL